VVRGWDAYFPNDINGLYVELYLEYNGRSVFDLIFHLLGYLLESFFAFALRYL
jgi:hypothetical protein